MSPGRPASRREEERAPPEPRDEPPRREPPGLGGFGRMPALHEHLPRSEECPPARRPDRPLEPLEAPHELHGDEHRVPLAPRNVAPGADEERESVVDGGHPAEEPPDVPPVASSRPLPGEGVGEDPAEHGVEDVAHARRAVVLEIVVEVVPVPGLEVLADEAVEFGRLLRGEEEFIRIDAPPGRAVRVEQGAGLGGAHAVEHAAPEEARDEVRVGEVEETPVPRQVLAGQAVADPYRVVPEPLPDRLALADRQEKDLVAVRGGRREGGGRRLAGREEDRREGGGR